MQASHHRLHRNLGAHDLTTRGQMAHLSEHPLSPQLHPAAHESDLLAGTPRLQIPASLGEISSKNDEKQQN